MGYLGYDAYTKEAFIPNREVAEVFQSAIETGEWDDVSDALEKSEDLLNRTGYRRQGYDILPICFRGYVSSSVLSFRQ